MFKNSIFNNIVVVVKTFYRFSVRVLLCCCRKDLFCVFVVCVCVLLLIHATASLRVSMP